MDNSDYQPKMHSLLQDQNTYTKIPVRRRNPTSNTGKSLNALLKQIRFITSIHDPDVQQLDDKLYYVLRSTYATLATFFLPKIHKPEVPLIHITSSISCPNYQVSKHLASNLSPLQNKEYTVTNTCDFVWKISVCTIDPQEIVIFFDVVSNIGTPVD